MKDSERREHEKMYKRTHDVKGCGGNKTKNDGPREPKYQAKYHNYTPLVMTRERALMMVENEDVLKWPRHTRFHRERGHNTEECFQLKEEIESGCKTHKDRSRSRSRSRDSNPDPAKADKPSVNRSYEPTKGVIYTIAGGTSAGDSQRTRKRCARVLGSSRERKFVLKVEEEEAISFGSSDGLTTDEAMNDPMVVKLHISNFTVHKILVDSGCSTDIIFKSVIDQMGLENACLELVKTPLVGFGGSEVASLGMIELPVSMGKEPKRKTLMVKFLVVDTPLAYNVILGRPGLNVFEAVISTYHMKMKFPTENGVGELACDQREARKCYNLSLKGESKHKKMKVKEDAKPRPYKAEHLKPSDEYKAVQLVESEQGRTTRIGANMGEMETTMVDFLRKNVDMFAWSPSDFKGINPEVIVHRLNVDPMARPVQQKKRSFRDDKNRIIEQGVAKLLKAGYVSEVQYTEWLSNVVLVPKASGKWRMCTDFTDLNKA
ncbi:UNVERIFIED_CONTAM: hypothetical protein Sindi_1305900 [Sesamum indicum]